MMDVRRLLVGEGSETIAVTLDDLAREGARKMIATALEPRSATTSSAPPTARRRGYRLALCNGPARERSCGRTARCRSAPMVNDKRVDEADSAEVQLQDLAFDQYAASPLHITTVIARTF